MGRISVGITLSAVFAFGLAAGIAASAAPAHAASTPAAIACAAAKRRSAIKRLRAINTCFSKASSLNMQNPDPACIAKADQALQREFLRIERRGGCLPATGDATAAERAVNRCETSLIQLLPGTCIEAGSLCSDSVPCCGGLCVQATGQLGTCS